MRLVTTPYDGPPLRGVNGVGSQPSGLNTARVLNNGIHHYIYLPCGPRVPIEPFGVVIFYQYHGQFPPVIVSRARP